MAKEQNQNSESAAHEATVASPEQAQQGVQLRIDESSVQSFYAATARVSGTAEEIVMDLAQRIMPGANNSATMKIDARVIMSPWAAKRLAMALGQAVQRFEQAYGTIEVDARKRAEAKKGA